MVKVATEGQAARTSLTTLWRWGEGEADTVPYS